MSVKPARPRRTAFLLVALLALPAAAAAARESPDWPMFRADAQHTGACGSEVPAVLGEPLKVRLGTARLTSPVASGELVITASADGTLFAVWADNGALAWSRPLGSNASAEPAIDGDTVYALTEDGKVSSFNATNGALLWEVFLPAGLGYTLPLTFSDGSLLVSTTSGTVLLLSAAERGRELWNASAGGRIRGPVTVGGNLAYALLEGGRAVALDLRDGSQNWSTPPGLGSSNEFPSAYVRGRLYIGTRGREVFCLDSSSGDRLWNRSLRSAISGAPALGSDLIVVGMQNGQVHALNLSDGEPAWPGEYDVGATVALPPVLAGGMVMVGNDRGTLYLLSASTGQMKTQRSLGDYRLSSPAVSEGRILLTTSDGWLLILGPVVSRPVAVLGLPAGLISTGEEVAVSGASSTGADGLPAAFFLFDFGDGTDSGWTGERAVTHSYARKGTYPVSLVVRDENGTQSRACRGFLEVRNDRPSVSLDIPVECLAGQPAALGAAAFDPDGLVVLYEWDFDGDGDYDWSGGSLPAPLNHTYDRNGTYRPAVRVTDDNGSKAVASGELLVLPERRPAVTGSGGPPISLPAAAASVSLVTLAALGAGLSLTEFGKYRLLTLLLVPLYVRLKKDEVLDNYLRGKIHGYITANPGDHYNSIRDALELSNGIVAHHLHTLEREGLVQSMRDGMYRRFFPANARLPPEDEGHFNIQKRIVATIRQNPGISQKEIAQKVGVSSPTVNYHINVLATARMIRVEKWGRRTRCYVVEDQPRN